MSFKASLFQESNWWINPFLFSAVFCETEDHTHQTIQLLNLSSQALGSAISFLFSSQSSSNQCLHCSHLNQKTAPGYNSKYWFFPGKWASNLHIRTHSPQIYIIIHDPNNSWSVLNYLLSAYAWASHSSAQVLWAISWQIWRYTQEILSSYSIQLFLWQAL